GQQVTCSICAARLEIIEVSPEIKTRRYPQDPESEIRERVDTYAEMKGYVFNEDKELVLEGLLQKYEAYGDFYCPCRLENIPENVCPCLDTRKGEVRREGVCL
ncbi:MAG: ferredoxin-thioredoxin reductase catalytic domain-containing protein, partial [Desulfovermiculus sp.]